MIKEKVCHYLPVVMGVGGIIKKATNGDIGGGGLKFNIFAVTSTSFLKGALVSFLMYYLLLLGQELLIIFESLGVSILNPLACADFNGNIKLLKALKVDSQPS